METVNLFDLANRQSRWLAVRQASIASNVANINTPGYGASTVEPFEKVLNGSKVSLASTQPGHFGSGRTDAAGSAGSAEQDVAILPTQEKVSLENELMQAGEVRRAFELNTAIVKAFHRMMLLSVKA